MYWFRPSNIIAYGYQCFRNPEGTIVCMFYLHFLIFFVYGVKQLGVYISQKKEQRENNPIQGNMILKLLLDLRTFYSYSFSLSLSCPLLNEGWNKYDVILYRIFVIKLYTTGINLSKQFTQITSFPHFPPSLMKGLIW